MSQLRCLLPLIMLALAGCAGLLRSNAPAVQLYVLPAPSAVAAAATGSAAVATPSAGLTLRVARPLMAAGLNTDRIALLRPGSRLDYYAGSRWSAPLADVVADLQVAVLRADPTWSAITDERSGLNTDYVLQTSISQFTAVYTDEARPPQINVSVDCLLVRRSDGRLLGRFTATTVQPAQANRMASVIAAFSAAADGSISSVAAQVAAQLKSAKPPVSP